MGRAFPVAPKGAPVNRYWAIALVLLAAGSAQAAQRNLDRTFNVAPGGTLIVYTGAAIVAGNDTFAHAVLPALGGRDVTFRYEELDPDVFGEELDQPGYEDVERISAVGLLVQRPR